jgi:hypothetical protein
MSIASKIDSQEYKCKLSDHLTQYNHFNYQNVFEAILDIISS